MVQKKPTKEQQKEISKGVEKMVHSYERSGKIKTSRATYRPEDKKKAIKQALAIEYARERVGRVAEEEEKK